MQDNLVPIAFLNTDTGAIVGADGITLSLGAAAAAAAPSLPGKRPYRRRADTGKISRVEDMPYQNALPSMMVFAHKMLKGADDQELSGNHKESPEFYVKLFNRDPKNWTRAATLAHDNGIKVALTPSAAMAAILITERLNPEKAAEFWGDFRKEFPDKRPIHDLKQACAAISGEGRRVEQARHAILGFRSWVGMPFARPLFPHVTRG